MLPLKPVAPKLAQHGPLACAVLGWGGVVGQAVPRAGGQGQFCPVRPHLWLKKKGAGKSAMADGGKPVRTKRATRRGCAWRAASFRGNGVVLCAHGWTPKRGADFRDEFNIVYFAAKMKSKNWAVILNKV